MSVARISRPQLLDPSLRPTLKSVDQKSIGVGCYLRRDSRRQASERGGQCLPEPEHALETRQGDLYVLPYARSPPRALGDQQDVALDQRLSLGPRSGRPSPRTVSGRAHLPTSPRPKAPRSGKPPQRWQASTRRRGGHGCSAQQVQLHSVDAEGTPSDPRRPIETRRLADLPRMHNRKQGRVYEQGLWIAHKLGHDLASQGFQEAP